MEIEKTGKKYETYLEELFEEVYDGVERDFL
jgi:hypothetical protein